MPKSLRSFFCEHHNSTFEVSYDNFDLSSFIEDAEILDRNDFVVRTDGLPARKSWKEHGHISVEGSDGEVRVEIILHAGPFEKATDGPPIETRIQDLLNKVTLSTVTIQSRSHFRFPKGYFPRLMLNYPAFLDDDNPDSAFVSGQEVTFRDTELANTAFLRYTKDQCFIAVRSTRNISLKGLNFHDLAAMDFKAAQTLTEKISE